MYSSNIVGFKCLWPQVLHMIKLIVIGVMVAFVIALQLAAITVEERRHEREEKERFK